MIVVSPPVLSTVVKGVQRSESVHNNRPLSWQYQTRRGGQASFCSVLFLSQSVCHALELYIEQQIRLCDFAALTVLLNVDLLIAQLLQSAVAVACLECFQHCLKVVCGNLRRFITTHFDIMCQDATCTHSIRNNGRLSMTPMEGMAYLSRLFVLFPL